MLQSTAMKLLKKYGISVPKSDFFKTYGGTRLKKPLALKIDTRQALHKTDMGLVVLDLRTDAQIKSAVKRLSLLMEREGIYDYGFILQEMVSGTELIMGMKKDDTFGPVIVFGLGGVMVEVIKDVSMRVAPLTKYDAYKMIDEIKGKKVLQGYRGSPAVDPEVLVGLLLKLSELSMNEKLKEIDFNPVIASEKAAYVVDARLIEC